ncbi:MAG: histidine kinase [uncultured bacterium]|nr:MAG: histidine kinase [uncultured bacterium]
MSDNLLELAQNGSSLKNSPKEKVSVLEVVNDAVSKVNKLTKAKQIKIENKVKDIEVLGIKDRLTEVFVILLDNSIKYSRKKGKVEIASKQTGGKVEISITDHGMGISEKDLPHIFDRFYRSDESRSENGYGLGLSIAKKIVESHKGSISAASNSGKGTIFKIFLPIS